MLGGYAGKILHVDLSKRMFKKEILDPKFARAFLGGRGFGAKLLFDHLAPGVDPFSPDNVLIFATGPFTGTNMPKGQRYSVVTKSPLTGGYGDGEGGGHFGPELKFAGYDALIIKGKSDKPVYVWIDDETARLEDATHIWGRGVFEADKIIKDDKADKLVRVAAVGPAAEKLVRFAAVTNDLYRHAARGGGGAVMGSKNLKAVAVRGFGGVEAANTDEFNKVAEEAMKKTYDNPGRKGMYDWGTWGGGGGWDLKQYNLWGIHPTRNYRSGYFENYEKIYGKNFRDRLLLKQRACFACPLACGRHALIRDGPYKGTFVEGPEYETITMLGSDCGVDNIEAIAKAHQMCDDLGFDGISAGNVVAFAMECYEKGLITKEQTGGIELKWGDPEAQMALLKKIAYREDIGDVLAEGVKIAAEKIGGSAPDFAMHVKGLPLPAYEPRGALGQALAFAIADLGGSHDRAWTYGEEITNPKLDRFSTEGKAELVKNNMRMRTLPDILGYCRFVLLSYDDYAKAMAALTGWNITAEELMTVPDKVTTLTRAFNVREGFGRKDDILPPRAMKEPVVDGPTKGRMVTKEELDKMLDEYYLLMGWDKDGIPKRETLEKYGMTDVAEKLTSRGILLS